MRVLIVEDSDRIRESLAAGLRTAGYSVDTVADGKRGLIHLRTTEYDVAVLDLGLPEMDGLTVLREARAKGVQTSVLILTARDGVDDKVRGLRTGADDFLIKPFSFDELLARIEALVRRRHKQASPILSVADLRIDTVTKSVTRQEQAIELTRREYSILECLAYRAGVPISRAELEETVYDDRSAVQSNAIDSAISLLRSKLNVGGRENLVHTKRGFGYVLASLDTKLDR
jgi:DNA-binding response OmpR family regulator